MRRTKRMLPDPHEAARVLDLPATAGGEDVRAAYLRLVRLHPPDGDPEAFERIRDAYEVLRDPERAAGLRVMKGDPGAPFSSLLDGEPATRAFVGPAPWLAALGRM